MISRTHLFIVAALLCAIGCPKPTLEEQSRAKLANVAELQLTAQSHHKSLQAEIALVRAEQGLPKQIDAAHGIGLAVNKKQNSTAAVLNVAFSPNQLKTVRERTDKLFAHDVSQWNPLVLEQALQLRATYDGPFQRARAALASPAARLPLPLASGLGSNGAVADVALVYVRFELIDALNALSRGDAKAAVKAIHQSLCVAELLAAEPNIVARLTGATARRETLGALQRLLNSFTVDAPHLSQFEQRLSSQLAAWPSDTDAWIGDRAQGLCLYEMVREGHILSVLTEDELIEIRRGDGIDIFTAAVLKNVDIDEAHYLAAMRDIIGACERPYFERIETFDKLNRERAALINSPDYPILADRYLLVHIAAAQRQQAADLALVKAWNLALAVARGASLPPHANPLTGENFDVTIASDHVVVRAIDPLHPELQVQAPITTPARISSRREPTPAQPR